MWFIQLAQKIKIRESKHFFIITIAFCDFRFYSRANIRSVFFLHFLLFNLIKSVITLADRKNRNEWNQSESWDGREA